MLSLLVAAAGALAWPFVAKSWLSVIFGSGKISIAPVWQNLPNLLGLWAASYVVWSLLLVPHMIARLLYTSKSRGTAGSP